MAAPLVAFVFLLYVLQRVTKTYAFGAAMNAAVRLRIEITAVACGNTVVHGVSLTRRRVLTLLVRAAAEIDPAHGRRAVKPKRRRVHRRRCVTSPSAGVHLPERRELDGLSVVCDLAALTVGETVAYPLRVRRKSESRSSKPSTVLAVVGDDYAERHGSSGGQQQRVASRGLRYSPAALDD